MPAPIVRVLRLDTWEDVKTARYLNGFKPERLTLTLSFVVTVEVRDVGVDAVVVVTTAAGQIVELQPGVGSAIELARRLEELVTRAQR